MAGDREPASVLAREVFAAGSYRRFGELTLPEVEAQAAELEASVGWGPTMRVRPVAMAWRELAELMAAEKAPRVADLDPVVAAAFAERLWIVPPRDSMLGRDPA
jgi:hypothetical protein